MPSKEEFNRYFVMKLCSYLFVGGNNGNYYYDSALHWLYYMKIASDGDLVFSDSNELRGDVMSHFDIDLVVYTCFVENCLYTLFNEEFTIR